MNQEELKFLISQGEGYNIEFKESYSDSLGKEICAFANANGGRIILGITDKGEIMGINITNRMKSQMQDTARNLDPKLEVSIEEAGKILIVNVPEGPNKPYSTGGKFYMRHGTNSQQLSRDEIREFFQKEGLVLFDEKLNYDFDMKKDFNSEAYKIFLRESRINTSLGTTEILNNLSLMKGNVTKNAGVLLFCGNVFKFFASATITCALFQGTSKVIILDKKEFEADAYSNFTGAMNYLKSKLNSELIITSGIREENLELPEKALREALLNAMVHRDYLKGANIQVHIFSDRVEITNPGGLVKGIRYEDLGKKSASRNNLLFGVMQRMGLVERIGSGIGRMREQMKKYGLSEPEIETDENWFTITFRRQEAKGRLVEKFGEGSEKSSEKILELIRQNKSISAKEISSILKISDRAVEKNIAKLKSKGILKRVGPDKGGHWEIAEKERR
jgi:ATP-dependent DNA helicase RecG